MSQPINHNITFGSSASLSSPIGKLPVETLMEIFKVYAMSNPEVLDQRVVDLCLVAKHWNVVANCTPRLWTKINLFFPFGHRHLAVAQRRVRASKLEEIDVSIDFRDPEWDGCEPLYNDNDSGDTNESIWVKNIMAVLRGTEKRWKSIKVVSETWLPLYKLMKVWRFTHLPSLGSVSMERPNATFGMRDVLFNPQVLVGPMSLFDHHASMPNLTDLSLSAVHVDWDEASVGFQNLRKLKVTNQTYDVGPSFEQFAAMLSSSPHLEYLDVSGFCPEHHTGPLSLVGIAPHIPVVHLPALKELTFGWKDIYLGNVFLQMFQIGRSLESLTLLDTESGFGCWGDPQDGSRGWIRDSGEIFEDLYELGPAASWDWDVLPPGPFISVSKVRKLRIAWTKASWLVPLLETMEELEEIWLEDVDEEVFKAVVSIGRARAREGRPLSLDLRWMWEKEVPRLAERPILELEEAGTKVYARGGGITEAWS